MGAARASLGMAIAMSALVTACGAGARTAAPSSSPVASQVPGTPLPGVTSRPSTADATTTLPVPVPVPVSLASSDVTSSAPDPSSGGAPVTASTAAPALDLPPKVVRVPDSIEVSAVAGARQTGLHSFFHVLSDGRLVDNPPCLDGSSGTCGTIAILDERTGTRSELQRPPGKGRAIAHYFGSDDRYLAWSSDPGEDLSFTAWEIWAAPTDGSSPARRIATAPVGADGQPLGTSFIIPRVSNGIVVWSALTPATPGADATLNVLMAQADGSRPAEVLEAGAVVPDIAWPFVYMQKLDANIRPIQTLRIDLSDGSRRVLSKLPQPCYVRAARSRILCAVNGAGGDLYVADLDGNPLIDVKQGAGRLISWPEIGDRAVVWDDQNGAVLLDLNDLSIRYLTVLPNAVTVGAKGAFVWWAWSPDPNQTPSSANTARSVVELAAAP